MNESENLLCYPGLQNEAIFKTLEIKIKSMWRQDKYRVLCIDEMSIRAHFFFHVGTDKIGRLQDIENGKKYFIVAQNAFIMARCLYSNWKQPISYFFVPIEFNVNELLYVMKECIRKNIAGWIIYRCTC